MRWDFDVEEDETMEKMLMMIWEERESRRYYVFHEDVLNYCSGSDVGNVTSVSDIIT